MSDKEAKERMRAWKVLPEDDRPSWEAFKRQWQRRKDVCEQDGGAAGRDSTPARE